ncbi:MAG: DNA primase [Phycisphaerales bacterium]|nr:DNA primase [Phycisphaerales bacterium]
MQGSLKETVLEATDLVELIGERVGLTRKGKDFVGLCPFHADKKPSMYVSPTKQIFKCFACGAGGDAIHFVMKTQRLEFRDALGVLAKRAGIELKPQSEGDRKSASRRDELRKVMHWARTYFRRNLLETPAGGPAVDYAHRRGFKDETIERFGVGLALEGWNNLHEAATRAGIGWDLLEDAGLVVVNNEKQTRYDRFRHRLMFPITDGQGRVIAFGGRTLADDPAKYLNSPETPLFSKSRVLYGLDQARSALESTRAAIVVEGYVDVTMLHQAGFDNTVAPLGTALTDSQVKLLVPTVDTIFMCFDGDAAGLKAADRGVEVAIQHEVDVRVVIMPEGIDPADCITGSGPDALKSLLQSAIDALEFKWRSALKALGSGGPRARREALEAFLQFIAKAAAGRSLDDAQFGLVIGRLADTVKLPSRNVYELLAKAKSATRREASVQTPDTSNESSAYAASIHGLPGGLIAAAEELAGFALTAGVLSDRLDEGLTLAGGHCPWWRSLHSVVQRVSETRENFALEDVFAELEEAQLCELAERGLSRVRGREKDASAMEAARQRLVSELELLRIENLRGRLQQSDTNEAERDRAFRSLLDLAGRQHSVLGTGQR